MSTNFRCVICKETISCINHFRLKHEKCKSCLRRACPNSEDCKEDPPSELDTPRNAEKIIQCLQCSFTCVSLSILKRHQVKHGESSNYICSICKKPFKQKQRYDDF